MPIALNAWQLIEAGANEINHFNFAAPRENSAAAATAAGGGSISTPGQHGMRIVCLASTAQASIPASRSAEHVQARYIGYESFEAGGEGVAGSCRRHCTATV